MNGNIFTRPLHTLSLEDLDEVRKTADCLFVRLVQPFKQNRVVWEFDYKKTVRSAMRTGHMIPSYSRQEVTHPKSQLVIAMSLSGIDRCFAVGLIPLLAQLRKYLHFKLFIYTDDLIEAEFDDGFIVNDCDIAWNNVIAPVMLARLSEMSFDSQETKLLLIDSLGGGDSEWYTYASGSLLMQVQQTQRQFNEGSWGRVRRELQGRYDQFDKIPDNRLPHDWNERVARNCGERWVETPALRQYLIRYIFNPKFGSKQHGTYPLGEWDSITLQQHLGGVREKFKSVHLLSPSHNDVDRHRELMIRHGFLDFYHKADSLEGFAQTLINIVYGRETDRLTTPPIRFSNYVQTAEPEDDETSHSELTKTLRDCFAACPAVECLPTTQHMFVRRRRGTSELEDYPVPYNNICLQDFFHNRRLDSLFGDWRIDPLWASFGKLRKARGVLKFIKENRVRFDGSGLSIHPRDNSGWGDIKANVEYERHRTRALRQHVDDYLDLFSEDYRLWFEKLRLRHVVWCTVGKFKHTCLAASACPADEPSEQRETVWHELSHWAEHVCPLIGTFTNNLLQFLTGDFDRHKVIKVGDGEYAMPVKSGFTPWIVDYAGKWYRRHEPNLPNPTEVFSVHAEYFTTPESLVRLLSHDEFIAKAVGFILMGGPVALIDAMRAVKRREALTNIDQRSSKANSYEEKKPKEKSKEKPKEKPKVEVKPPVTERKSFGI